MHLWTVSDFFRPLRGFTVVRVLVLSVVCWDQFSCSESGRKGFLHTLCAVTGKHPMGFVARCLQVPEGILHLTFSLRCKISAFRLTWRALPSHVTMVTELGLCSVTERCINSKFVVNLRRGCFNCTGPGPLT